MNRKIVVLCYNYEPAQFPKKPDDENRFFTYGFGGTFGRLFHKYIKGFDIEVWRIDGYCENKYYEKNIDGVKYRIFRSYIIKKLGNFSINFFKNLRIEKKDPNTIFFIVHTHNWQTYQAAWVLKGSKIITTHHGDWSPFFLFKTTKGLRKLKSIIGMSAEKLTFKNINYFLICDHGQVKYIKKANPNMNYEIFSAGLDVKRFPLINKSEARKMLGLDLNKKYILYVGKMYKYKQVDRLIYIFNEIKKQIPETELLIVGNETKDKWGEEYYDLAVNNGAMVIGRVLNTDLHKYYCAADVYVLMSLRKDYFGGTGIAPLESLACNTPVVSNSLINYIGTNVEEIGEVPNTEEEYMEMIIKVLQKPEKYKNLQESVEKHYSFEAVSTRLERLFNNI